MAPNIHEIMDKLLEDFELKLISLVGVVGFAVYYIAYFLRKPFDVNHFIPFILLILSLFLLYVIKQSKKQKDDHIGIKDILEKEWVKAEIIPSRPEFYKKIKELIKDAEYINTAHFYPEPGGGPEAAGKDKEYSQTLENIIKGKNGKLIKFKRVVSIDNDNSKKLEWVDEQINTFSNCEKFNLFYCPHVSDSLPMLSMMLIDNKHVLFSLYSRNSDTMEEKSFHVTGREAYEFFFGYYRELLTSSCRLMAGGDMDKELEKLKESGEWDGKKLTHDVLKKISSMKCC